MALGNPVVLKIDNTRSGHLDRTKNCHHLQDSIVEAGSDETIVFFVTSPKIGTTHKAEKEKKPTFTFFKSINVNNQIFVDYLGMLRTTMPCRLGKGIRVPSHSKRTRCSKFL
jgi:phenylalanyl-tRNA synthetase beta subunit